MAGGKTQYHSLTWRPVGVVPGGGPAYRATPLLLTADRDRFTWLEDHRYANSQEFDAALNELMKNGAVRAAKNLSDEPRQVAVAVSGRKPTRGEWSLSVTICLFRTRSRWQPGVRRRASTSSAGRWTGCAAPVAEH